MFGLNIICEKKEKKMLEKEYKFLVNEIPHSDNVVFMKQYYFDTKKFLGVAIKWLKLDLKQAKGIDSIRLRQCVFENETTYFLTAKSKGDLYRREYEMQIPARFATNLLKFATKFIEKSRSILTIDNLKFEFDFYYKRKDKLKVCEVEVKKDDEYKKILKILTQDLGLKVKDITFDSQYKNFNLAKEL